MKIYRVSWCEPVEGICYAWHGSRRSAERDPRRVRAEWPDVNPLDLDIEIEVEQFPGTKPALLRWLNTHVTRYS